MKLLPDSRKSLISNAVGIPSAALLKRVDALLLLLPAGGEAALATLAHGATLVRERARLRRAPGSLWSVTLPTPRGTRVVVGELPADADAYQTLALSGRMVQRLASDEPARVALASLGKSAAGDAGAQGALLAAVLAATESRPAQKSKPARGWRLTEIVVCGRMDLPTAAAIEQGAHLTRWLTALPPNVLYPGSYRRALTVLAKRHGWRMRVYSEAALRRLGAGAYTAVARGSRRRDAALVHLEYRPRGTRRGAQRPIALVGKGICFDTGGHNIKSAKSMFDMHTDMNGSAVAVGALAALSSSGYPGPVDAWLALAENRIGPDAYTQQDVVTAVNGTTIQVTHTDAEGRMVLADTLALASRTRPACILDFATLTGACVYALTERMSGAFTNRAALRPLLEGAGARSGERVWNFPMPADFDQDLESPTADIVQCLLDGKGDHIYAARFLSRFVADGIPWAHFDLSSAARAGGLAHVTTPVTGFGVRLTVALLADPEFHRAIRGTARR